MRFSKRWNRLFERIGGDALSHFLIKMSRKACFLDIRERHFYITAAKNSDNVLVILMSIAILLRFSGYCLSPICMSQVAGRGTLHTGSTVHGNQGPGQSQITSY
jgi:hypothetical protein